MKVEIFPIHNVNAIGLKLDGDEGSSLADPLAISLMDAVVHACGTVDVLEQWMSWNSGCLGTVEVCQH